MMIHSIYLVRKYFFEHMLYEILIGYFAVRFALEVFFERFEYILKLDDVQETDIRCPCESCSGIYILN